MKNKIKPEKVKKLLITVFCIVTALGNIVQYSKTAGNGEIIFYDADTNAVQSLEEGSTSAESIEKNSGIFQDASSESTGNSSVSDTSEATEPNTVKDAAGSLLKSSAVQYGQNTKINLNTATSEELQTIKGIGPAKADAIIEYRNSYGGFLTIEEITEVKGIGESTYGKIKDLITVE